MKCSQVIGDEKDELFDCENIGEALVKIVQFFTMHLGCRVLSKDVREDKGEFDITMIDPAQNMSVLHFEVK